LRGAASKEQYQCDNRKALVKKFHCNPARSRSSHGSDKDFCIASCVEWIS
jgi:hypothetical protein